MNYFYDLSYKATLFRGPYFKGSLYLFKGYDGKDHLHPLEISIYSISCLQAFVNTREARWLENAEKNFLWLSQSLERNGALVCNHLNPIYSDLSAKWQSCLTYSFYISSGLRLYYLTKDKTIIENVLKAHSLLTKDFDHGGCRRAFKNLHLYEEYPRKQVSGVLNGHISGVLALIELNVFDHEIVDHQRIRKELENLKSLIPFYEKEAFVLYSLDGNVASGFYLRYVIVQLKVLGQFDPYFAEKGKAWENQYLNKKNALKGLIKKLKL